MTSNSALNVKPYNFKKKYLFLLLTKHPEETTFVWGTAWRGTRQKAEGKRQLPFNFTTPTGVYPALAAEWGHAL